jgi:hypothetical protein
MHLTITIVKLGMQKTMMEIVTMVIVIAEIVIVTCVIIIVIRNAMLGINA